MTGQALALFIVGLAAPFIIQQLKKLFGGLEDWRALWVAFGVSFALAALCQLGTGELAINCVAGDPAGCTASVLEAGLVVFGLATVVYKTLLSKKE